MLKLKNDDAERKTHKVLSFAVVSAVSAVAVCGVSYVVSIYKAQSGIRNYANRIKMNFEREENRKIIPMYVCKEWAGYNEKTNDRKLPG